MRERTGLDSKLGVVHVAADVSEDLGLEAHVADPLAVVVGLLRRRGRRELDVLDAKVAQRLGNLHLGLGVEEGVGELLALCAAREEKGRESAESGRRR